MLKAEAASRAVGAPRGQAAFLTCKLGRLNPSFGTAQT